MLASKTIGDGVKAIVPLYIGMHFDIVKVGTSISYIKLVTVLYDKNCDRNFNPDIA